MNPKQLNQQPVKIIIADDHELLRMGFATFLQNQPFVQLVAEAADGEQLIQLTGIHDPDIVLTDIQMPVMGGVEATGIITEKFPRTSVIAFTMFNQEYLIAEMLAAGAKGFILKQAHPSELTEAIKAVNNGQHYFCRSSTEKLNKLIAHKEYNPVTKARNIRLSPREKEVLLLICRQKTNKDISKILNISVRTVEDYRSNLLLKTQSQALAGLITFAVKQGIYIP
jgi:DNA-binding NarL/FixJ family response regulator